MCTISSIFFQIVFRTYCEIAASVSHKKSVNRHLRWLHACHACQYLFLVAKNPVISHNCFDLPIKLCDCLSYLFSIFLVSFCSVSLYLCFIPFSLQASFLFQANVFQCLLSRWFHFLLLIISICLNAFFQLTKSCFASFTP